MKKLIRSSMFLLAVCCIAGKSNAQQQLVGYDASKKPIISQQPTVPVTVTTGVSGVQPKAITGSEVNPVTAKTATTAAPTNIVGYGQQSKIPMTPKMPVISNQGGVTPVLTYTEPKVAASDVKPVQVSAIKSTAVQTTVPAPATQTIPVGALKTSVASQVPVVAAAAKTTEVNNGAGTLVPMPTVSLASGAVDAQVVATPAVAATQQTMGQAKPAEIKEVPASVINQAVKVPQIPMQSEEKTKKKN